MRKSETSHCVYIHSSKHTYRPIRARAVAQLFDKEKSEIYRLFSLSHHETIRSTAWPTILFSPLSIELSSKQGVITLFMQDVEDENMQENVRTSKTNKYIKRHRSAVRKLQTLNRVWK